jgi:hypothetical protein
MGTTKTTFLAIKASIKPNQSFFAFIHREKYSVGSFGERCARHLAKCFTKKGTILICYSFKLKLLKIFTQDVPTTIDFISPKTSMVPDSADFATI